MGAAGAEGFGSALSGANAQDAGNDEDVGAKGVRVGRRILNALKHRATTSFINILEQESSNSGKISQK